MVRSGRRNRTGIRRDAADREDAVRLRDTEIFLLFDSSSVTQQCCNGCGYVSGDEDTPMVLVQSAIRNGRRHLQAPLCIDHVDEAVAFFRNPSDEAFFETTEATLALLEGRQQCPVCWRKVEEGDKVFKTQDHFGEQPLIHADCASDAADAFDAVWNYSGRLLSTKL